MKIFWRAGALAGPAIVSNITVPLLGLSDTFITGHLGSERYIAAISVGTMMVNAIYWLCGFLRMGTTGLTAEAYGKRDYELRRRILTAALTVGAGIGVAMILVSPLLKELMIRIIAPPEETAVLAGRYFLISVCAAPAILATMVLSGWMVGSQNTVYPMVVAISVNVINIAMSFTLVFGFDFGFIGVAIGTLTANWLGVLISLLLARRLKRKGERMFSRLKGLFKELDVRRFFKVNGNLFIRSACLMSVSFGLTAFAGKMGDSVLAVNAILMQFFFFFSYFMDGFAFAGEALVGRFSGEKNYPAMWTTVKSLLGWSGIVTIVFTTVYFFFSNEIASMLTDEASVVAGVEALRWVLIAMPAISVAAFMFDGVYVGLTDTSRMMLATMSGAIIFFGLHYLLPVIFPLSEFVRGGSGLWLCFLTFLFVRGLVLAVKPLPKN